MNKQYVPGSAPAASPRLAEPIWSVTIPVATLAELRSAIATAANTPTRIELTNDITLTTGGQLSIPTTGVIKITSSGGPYTINANNASRVVNIAAGATLYLEAITLTGGRLSGQGAGAYNAGILVLQSGAIILNNVMAGSGPGIADNMQGGGVYNTGTLTLQSGSGILGNSITWSGSGSINVAQGGGVYNRGMLNMEGGAISNSHLLCNGDGGGVNVVQGGGVYNGSGGIFTMTDGQIAGNVAENVGIGGSNNDQGGGIYNAGTFTMAGGALYQNRVTYNYIGGSSNVAQGGGVYNYSSGTFTMAGGRIYENTTNYSNGSTTSGSGGGVYNIGDFTLENGEIASNDAFTQNGAAGGSGGGVYNAQTFAMAGGAIDQNTANSGGGVYNGANFTMENGEIYDNSATAAGGGIYNSYGFNMQNGVIAGNQALNGGGIYQGSSKLISIEGDSRLTGNVAGSNGGAIWISYANLPSLNVGPDVVFANNSAARAYNIAPADIPLHMAHILTSSFTVPFTYGYNNYDISYTAGRPYAIISLTATKAASGAPLVDGRFTFGVYDATGQLLSTATNDAAGNIRFPAIALEQGTYVLTLRETTPSGDGWTTDDTIYPVDIMVSSTGVAQVSYPQGPPMFANAYFAAPAAVGLTATKLATGAALPAGRFEFGIFDSNGNLIDIATNDALGNVVWPAITIDEPDVYDYTLRELTPSGGGWTTDGAAHPAIVTVTDNGMGQLIPDIQYPSGPPEFTDVYSAAPASMNIVAYKELLDWPHPEIPFTFGLYDKNEDLVETAQNQEGVIEFSPISYSKPGTYYYTLSEITPSGDNWITDPSVYPVTVTVADDGEGQLITEVEYPSGQPIFTNTYVQPTVDAALQGHKTLCGACLQEGMFTFGLFDENGNEIARATNDASGGIYFPALTFTQPSVYRYTVRELNPSNRCWNMDSTVYPAIITVTSDAQGGLVASIDYPQGQPNFVNRYCPPCRQTCCSRKRCPRRT
ncbi:MAG: hypothetical protein LBN26_07620 [Christensenellaceae bacterium]|jgi:pilin isopeptide linkage protein|nr:hypothetical protein [Christensenellaceae bacterium]